MASCISRFSLCLITLLFPLGVAVAAPELPLFAGKPRTAEQKKADENLKAQFLQESEGDLGGAVDARIAAGWKSIAEKNSQDAIRHFNEAYLLSPKDYRLYWGFGAVSAQDGDVVNAKQFFEKAITMSPTDPRLLSDYALFAMHQGVASLRNKNEKNAKAQSEKWFVLAEKQVSRAVELKPYGLPLTRRAFLRYYRGDFKGAWDDVHAAQHFGGEGLDPVFVASLTKAMAEPANRFKQADVKVPRDESAAPVPAEAGKTSNS